MSSTITLITGGSRGLGRDAALKLASRGNDVILTYRADQAAADDVVSRIREKGRHAIALQLDVADSSRFAGFAAQVREALSAQRGATGFD
ncbi:MAG TPA: SDR family NAD(P)-dependent oxidoreductase, partial [Castellaniella sp.]|nr:SDR family NAD(P)-dependent oxidoreductase [Castellaniella sp.]